MRFGHQLPDVRDSIVRSWRGLALAPLPRPPHSGSLRDGLTRGPKNDAWPAFTSEARADRQTCMGLKMTKKKKVAELERNIERVFLEFSIVVLVVVLTGMMIATKYMR